MDDIEIKELPREAYEDAARLLARAFRDLPTTLVCLGDDPGHRMRFLHRAYRTFLPQMKGTLLSAWRDDALVGVTGIQTQDECKLSLGQKLRIAPWIVTGGWPWEVWRVLKVFDERDRRDWPEPHLHVEPIAIEPATARLGVGKRLGAAVCAEADRRGMPIFGITERQSTTQYLAAFGVEVIDEFDIHGVPNYALWREPRTRQAVSPPSTTSIAPVT